MNDNPPTTDEVSALDAALERLQAMYVEQKQVAYALYGQDPERGAYAMKVVELYRALRREIMLWQFQQQIPEGDPFTQAMLGAAADLVVVGLTALQTSPLDRKHVLERTLDRLYGQLQRAQLIPPDFVASLVDAAGRPLTRQ
jgi:hypothetical protein